MKKLLLIFAIAICMQGMAQKKDTATVGWSICCGSGTGLIGVSDMVYIGGVYDTVPTYKDTVRVILLCSDTLNRGYYGQSSFWRLGYAVYKKGWQNEAGAQIIGGNMGVFTGYMTFIGYIDEKKKSLPPSVIVWMAKEIEKK